MLIIYDPKRYIYVSRYLRERGIKFTVPDSIEDLSSSDIVYTDDEKTYNLLKNMVRRVFLDKGGSRYLLEKAILSTNDKDCYNLVSVGVDPGSRYTVVVIGDGELIEWRHVGNIEGIVDHVRELVNNIPTRFFEVKIGVGVNGSDIAYSVKRVVRDKAVVELVDERESSPSRVWRNPFIEKLFLQRIRGVNRVFKKKDVYAAIMIALKKGVLVETSVEDRDTS